MSNDARYNHENYRTYFIEERIFSVRHSHSFLGVSPYCYWNLLYIIRCEHEDLVSATQWKNKMDREYPRTKFCKKILASKMEKVRRWWSRLHNEKPNNLYSSRNLIRVIRWERMPWIGYGEMRNSYTVTEKHKERRPFVISRRNVQRAV